MHSELLSDGDLAEIKRRVERATPGPWIHASEGIIETKNPHRRILAMACRGSDRVIPSLPVADNGAFISHARTDIQRLIAEVERLRAMLNGHVKHD